MDNRPPVYEEGDRIVYRASAFGLPVRSLVAARLGHEPYAPPDAVRQAGQEGTRLESSIKDSLGVPVHDDQRQVEFHHGAAIVRGHIDGRLSVRQLLEVKTVTQAGLEAWQARRWKARPGWAWQVSCYCEALELGSVVMAVMARDTGEVDRWEDAPPYQAHHIRERIDTVEHFVGLGQLPPRDDTFSGWDPWSYLHRLESVADPEMGQHLRDYIAAQDAERQAQEASRAAKAQRESLKARIVFLMGDRQKVHADGLEATRSRNGSLTLRTT